MSAKEEYNRALGENWLARMRRLGLARYGLQPMKDDEPTVVLAALPKSLPNTDAMTPLPSARRQQHTDALKLTRRTDVLSLSQICPAKVRDTQELVSSAILRFIGHYGIPPNRVQMHPIRCLAVDTVDTFFTTSDACAMRGCYTVEVQPDATLDCDEVRCISDKPLISREPLRNCYL